MDIGALVGIAASIAAAHGPHYYPSYRYTVVPRHRYVHVHRPRAQQQVKQDEFAARTNAWAKTKKN